MIDFFKKLVSDNDQKRIKFPAAVYFLNVTGNWPVNEHYRHGILGYAYDFYLYYVNIQLMFILLCELAYAYYNWGDIPNISECFSSQLTGYHALCRMANLFIQRDKYIEVLDYFGKHIYITASQNIEVSKKCNKEVNFAISISISFLMAVTMYAVIPIFTNDSKERQLPYKMVLPYDAVSTPNYHVTYYMAVKCGYDAVCMICGQDTLFSFFLIYTCGQFSILKENFESIRDVNIETGVKLTLAEKREAFKKSLKHHNVVLRFTELLEDLFSPSLLANFMSSSMLFCLVVFQLALVRLSPAEVVKFSAYLAALISQLYIICLQGDKLIESSTAIADAAYNCEWTGPLADVTFTKEIMFTMARSQRAQKLTAFRFSKLCLEGLTAILSTSMSYFTLLKTLVQDSTF